MIEPSKADIGRKVVYRPKQGKAEEGVVTSFTDKWVFVRFGAQAHSMATFRDDLEWITCQQP